MRVAEFSVRQVHNETRAELTRVLQAAARELENRGEPLWPPASLEPGALRDAYPQAEMVLGTQDGQGVAGMILLTDDPLFWPDVPPGESLFVHKLAVVPALQGAGVASRMLGFAGARAEALGKRYLRLDCAAERPRLRAFYERHGFCWVGERNADGFLAALYERDVSA